MAGRKLTALSSVVIDSGRIEKELNCLSEKEKSEIMGRMCKNVNSAMGDYFTQHKNEWIEFVNSIKK